MTAWRVGLFVALGLLVEGPGIAQPLPGAVYQSLDYPRPSAQGWATMGVGMFLVAGWAVDCPTGQLPPAILIQAQRLTIGTPQLWSPTSVWVARGLSRPDVQTALQGTCPRTSAFSGYAARVWPPLPAGYWRVYVTWVGATGNSATTNTIVQVIGS